MTPKQPDSHAAAGRLRDALSTPDALAREHVQDELQAFVEAELAGVDVDALPEYAQILRHLDQCEECSARYSALADDLSALAGMTAPLSPDMPAAPAFFPPARQDDHVVLRVFRDVLRRFELKLQAPALIPAVATLGGGSRVTLFTDTLPEIAGSPLISVVLSAQDNLAELLVAIRETQAAPRWQIQITAADLARSAVTDARGIATFDRLPLASLRQLTLTCAELPADD